MSFGRMTYMSDCLSRQTSFTFNIPNDSQIYDTDGNPYYDRPMKALYLLHGYSGNEYDWQLDGIANQISKHYNLAVFCITGGNNFYLDGPATGSKYGTFAGKEIVEFTRKTFGLSEKREDTLIGGFSMGGFGAIHTSLMFPETFGATIALSSALVVDGIADMKEGDDNGIANEAYYRQVFGDLSKVRESDANPEVLYDRLVAEGRSIPKLYMAIGTEDFLYEPGQEYRKFLESRNADFIYEEGPGVHNFEFWNPHLCRGIEALV